MDSVSEALNIKSEEIEETPSFGARLTTDYIPGIAKSDGGVNILLGIDPVRSGEDVDYLQTVA